MKLTKSISIFVLFLIISFPLHCQINIKDLSWIDDVIKSEDEKGINLEFHLKRPLESFPEWFVQGENLIISFYKSYIDPPKTTINLNSPVLREIKIVQYDPITVRAVFYGKSEFEDKIEPKIYKSSDLSYIVYFPYPVNLTKDQKATNLSSENKEPSISLKKKNEVETEINPDKQNIPKDKIDLSHSKKTIQNQLKSNSENNTEESYLDFKDGDKPQIPSLSKSLLKSFASLLIVLALIILTAYLLKRFFFSKGELRNPEKSVKILSNNYIGDKKRICLVEVLGKILVLGITNTNINLLTEIEGDQVMDIVSEEQNDDISKKPFEKILKDAHSNINTDKIDSKAKNLSNILKNFISKTK